MRVLSAGCIWTLAACTSVPLPPPLPSATEAKAVPTAPSSGLDGSASHHGSTMAGHSRLPASELAATGPTVSSPPGLQPSQSTAPSATDPTPKAGLALSGSASPSASGNARSTWVAPLRTLTGAEEVDPSDRSDLWERVRRGFAMSDLESDLVRRWEQWYATRPDYVQRMTERGGRYLFHVVEEVQRRGLPTELALLPFIESAFNPNALSVASASGMWQFMPATGRQFELKQNLFRDDRRDILASTRAALDYLQMLHQMFGDWHLALAAYNWGQGNVQRALERNRRAREDLVYTALRMPDETRNYVPKLQAVKNIVLSPSTFGLSLPVLENHPFFLTVTIERDMDVELVARLAGLSIEEFQTLNPQLNKPVLLAAGTPQVLLPYDNANRFVRELARHPGPLASLTAWIAPRTLRPQEAAKLTGVSESRLKELNRIPDKMLIKAGSALIVPRHPDHAHDVAEEVADQGRMQLTPDGPRLVRKTLKAHPKGETLAAFAKRHGVDPAEVARWNKLPAQAALRPSQAMIVMAPAPTGTATSAKPRSAATKSPVAQGHRKAKAPQRPVGQKTDRRTQASDRR